MIATKRYEDGKVIAYVDEGRFSTEVVFCDEEQMRRMGECLRDLARGARSVELKSREEDEG